MGIYKKKQKIEKMSHLCIGCGICAAVCPDARIAMLFDELPGIYQPSTTLAFCEKGCGICEKVCPFIPENEITDITRELFSDIEGIKHDAVLGYFLSTRLGYSSEHRITSASGGLVTCMLTALVNARLVDHVLCVGPDQHSPTLFNFRVCKNIRDIKSCSGSCYQPVEFSKVLRYVLENDGRYAITALPCMAKALRLAMHVDSRLKRRIVYILGLTCGQLKSKHFVDYISERFTGSKAVTAINFRTKRPTHSATNYAYNFIYRDQNGKENSNSTSQVDNGQLVIEFNDISRIWSDRWFALEACDYCDDVFAECADAVFMDAWLPGLNEDWQGTSLIASRDTVLEDLLNRKIESEVINCQYISPEKILASQKGVIFQKRVMAGCNYEAARASFRIPKPRYSQITNENRKTAFIRRNVRRCMQNGYSTLNHKRVTWLTSSWGWRLAKLYSIVPILYNNRPINSKPGKVGKL